MNIISQQLLSRALKHYEAYKEKDFVLSPSLPILFFGDVEKYTKSTFRIMTAALNPSDMEFKEKKDSTPSNFRFPEFNGTPESLEKSLSNYFREVPYDRWFGKKGAKNGFLPFLNGMGYSYYDEVGKDIAIHTDLCSPLATNPTWSALNNIHRDELSEKGFELWKSLVFELQPNLILMSLKKRHINLLNPTLIQVLETFKSKTTGNRNPITYELILYSITIKGFKTMLLWGSAQNTPLQPFANKFELGKNILAKIFKLKKILNKNNPMDNIDDIIENYREIYNSQKSNNDKASNYRNLLERILKYALNINRDQNHPFRILRDLLRNHPSYFRLQLGTKVDVLHRFFSQFAHDNPNDCTVDELEEHRLLLAEFAEIILDYKFPIIDHNPVKIPEQPQMGNYETRNNFIINRDWVGQNKRFAVRFIRGNYQNETYYYDHDKVYYNAKQHLEGLPSFQKYGYNVCTVNIPGYALDYLDTI